MSFGLPTTESLADGVADNRLDITDLVDRANVTDRRHAELAALVSELTVAVEALERKVDAQLALKMAEDIGLVRFHFQSQTEGEGVT